MTVLLEKDTNDVLTPKLNLAEGGQQGILTAPFQWVSSASYVRQKIIAILVAAPKGMQYMSNPTEQVAALKSLIELMPQKIDGLNSTVTWDYDGPVVGNAGEKFVAPTKGSRAVSAPSITWSDKYGMAIAKFWTEFGRVLVWDPDLGFPALASLPDYISAQSPAILPDMQSMTVLFIEPDVTMTNVTNAWLSTNMMPMTGGDIIGKREMGGTGEIPEVNIEFTAYTMIGKAVNTLAKNYLTSLKLNDMRPLELKGIADAVSPDVTAAAIGLAKELSDAVMAQA